MKKDIIVVNESNDKLDCFARISKIKCNALKKKECKNCSFYKPKKEVPDYKKYLQMNDLDEVKVI